MSCSLFAQVHYSQNFGNLTLSSTGYATIPANMISINADGNTPDIYNPPFNAAPYTNLAFAVNGSNSLDTFAICTSVFTPAGTANRWLITPPVNGITANSILVWESRSEAINQQMLNSFEVWVSAAAGSNSNPVVTDFTNITSNKVFSLTGESSAWKTHVINLAAFAGQTVRIAFRDVSINKYFLNIDDITVVDAATNDLMLASVSPTGQSSWGVVNSTKTIAGVVKNNGSTAVTGFTVKYSDGGAIVSRTYTGLNIGYAQTYNFSFTTPYTITSASQPPLKVWVELTGDNNHNNDTLNSQIKGYSYMPAHKVVVEEGTGTWCGWCVRGAVFMDSMYHVYPSTTVLIAVHSADPMTDTIYDAAVSNYINFGYPSILVDRAYLADPKYIFTQYSSHINDFAVAELTVIPAFNATTRLATITVNTKPASSFSNNNASTDYRLAVVFTEMGVTGTGSSYDQHNYYSGGTTPMAGAGHNWQTEPSVVPAASMEYDFVARTILGGAKGQVNSLPNALVAGTTYSNNAFTYTVPAGYKENNIKVHALLIDAKNNIIYNANTADLISSSGIKSMVAGKQEFNLYPNPVQNILNLDLKLEEPDNVTVTVMNSLGEVVKTKNFGKVSKGSSVITLDVNDLASGAYFVNVATSKGIGTNKFIR